MTNKLFNLNHRAAFLRIGAILAILVVCGCSRNHYRLQADREVLQLLRQTANDPRWPLENYRVDPDPKSRMYDPFSKDCPPMPPDDPASHRYMHCVDGKRGWPWERYYGTTTFVENPVWRDFLPVDESGQVTLNRRTSIELALLHSRDYQRQLENLYLSALQVTYERFRFDTQFFGGNDTTFEVTGPLGGSASDSSQLSTRSPVSFKRLMATGAQLVVEVANSIVWQFSGDDGYVALTPVSLSLVQPLLRNAGRAVVLEQLTSAQRALLANIRQFERFRRGFYLQIIAGINPGPGPSSGVISIGSLSPGATGRAGGYLSLLVQQIQITNQRANVAALRDSLERIDAFYAAGRISRTQVDEIRQNLYSSQIELLSRRNNYQSQLDSFKITLGLPPEIPVSIRDNYLDQFNLLDPAVSETQQETNNILRPVREIFAELQDAQSAASGFQQTQSALQQAAQALAAQDAAKTLEALSNASQAITLVADSTERPEILQAAEQIRKAVDAVRVAPPEQSAQVAQAAIQQISQSLPVIQQAAEQLASQVLPQAQSQWPTAATTVNNLIVATEEHLQTVENDLQRLLRALPVRLERMERLAAQEVFRAGDVDPRIVDPEDLRRTVVELYAEFYGKDSPEVQQLVEQFWPDPANRRWFVELRQMPGIRNDLETLLDQLRDAVAQSEQKAQQAGQDIAAWNVLYQSLRTLLEDLANNLMSLSLLQARIRLEIPTLTPVELDPGEALEIARVNRRDWMNARAALVDQWRQVEIAANALKSDLSIVFNTDLTTRSDTISSIHNTVGHLSAGLQFDAPLTRLAERNAYRRALIQYQRAKRDYYAFVDRVSQTLRDNLREIRLTQLQFELQRAGVKTAIARVEQQQLELQRPPRPGQEEFTLGPTTARDLVTALRALLNAQNAFLESWVQYEVLRMILDFNLGTMEIDENGMWIDPGPIEHGRGLPREAPELIPPGIPAENTPSSAGNLRHQQLEPKQTQVLPVKGSTLRLIDEALLADIDTIIRTAKANDAGVGQDLHLTPNHDN